MTRVRSIAALGNNDAVTTVAIIGGGPGGYEAALVARQYGADVTLIDASGIGGSCVWTDCVPSKALIAAAGPSRDISALNARILDLAAKQGADIAERLTEHGVRLIAGRASFVDATTVRVDSGETVTADVVLVATGARPRVLADCQPDGERILTWEQIYQLQTMPEHLIVVGSGVTGAEFASAYRALGSAVTLVSSRDHVLPGEDPDAARVIEDVFRERGIAVLNRTRAVTAERTLDAVRVHLSDGSTLTGSHVLMAVGSVPNTEDLNLAAAGIETDDAGFIVVDRVSRTTARSIYAAGDCTGVLMLASVAAMQGRIAMWHALGEAVTPLDTTVVSSTVFTDPEIATVGVTERDLAEGRVRGESLLLPLATNARAKMNDETYGFAKLICRRGTRTVAGAVIVGPHASELIHALTIAVDQRMTVGELASVFTVYPSLSGSIAEAARQLQVSAD
jgi:pyruvate/2-oxoglutarate dehydrogenase complex dihydrolipoamide dehydrogenase (E3) component